MTAPDQFCVRPCGGSVQHDDKPQEVMPRNLGRCGGYLANCSEHVLQVFMGEAVQLQPWRGIVLGDWQGPVRLTGKYMQRFSAAEWTRP